MGSYFTKCIMDLDDIPELPESQKVIDTFKKYRDMNTENNNTLYNIAAGFLEQVFELYFSRTVSMGSFKSEIIMAPWAKDKRKDILKEVIEELLCFVKESNDSYDIELMKVINGIDSDTLSKGLFKMCEHNLNIYRKGFYNEDNFHEIFHYD